MPGTPNDPGRAVRRTQVARREESGRKLVEAAAAVVADEGLSAATFEAIGLKSGYSRSLVTQRFGSRQGLIEAVITYLRDHLDARMNELNIRDLPGLDAVLAYFDVYLRDLSEKGGLRAYFVLLSSAVADVTTLRPLFAAEHERVRFRLANMIRRGQAEGGINAHIDADAAGLMIGALQLGLSMQLIIDPDMDIEPIRVVSLDTLRMSFQAHATPNP